MALSQPARDAAGVLLDVLSVLDKSPESPRIMETALERMNTVGAVKVDASPPGGVVSVDVTHLVAGAVFTIQRLIDDITSRTGTTETDVIHALREWLQEA